MISTTGISFAFFLWGKHAFSVSLFLIFFFPKRDYFLMSLSVQEPDLRRGRSGMGKRGASLPAAALASAERQEGPSVRIAPSLLLSVSGLWVRGEGGRQTPEDRGEAPEVPGPARSLILLNPQLYFYALPRPQFNV